MCPNSVCVCVCVCVHFVTLLIRVFPARSRGGSGPLISPPTECLMGYNTKLPFFHRPLARVYSQTLFIAGVTTLWTASRLHHSNGEMISAPTRSPHLCLVFSPPGAVDDRLCREGSVFLCGPPLPKTFSCLFLTSFISFMSFFIFFFCVC